MKDLYSHIYKNLPYFIRVLISSYYGYAKSNEKFGKHFVDYFNFLNHSQYWDNERLKTYSTNKFEDFVNRVVKYTPYYKNAKIDSLNYNSFPIIHKSEVRGKVNSFINPNYTGKKITSHTSGTTGSAMIFPLSILSYQREYAFRAMHYSWANVGLTNKDKIAFFAGHQVTSIKSTKPPFWVSDLYNNHIYFSSYHLASQNLLFYVRKLTEFDPKMIHGYPSTIYIIAKAFEKYSNNKLVNLNAIFTSSETLLDFQRKTIESVFNVKVFNWYGTSEMTANIVECEKGELHLKHEHSYVEFLNDENKTCKPGEEGRIVSTNFSNDAFPLIRYDIGDKVKLSVNKNSKCGRGGQLIDEVLGRVENYVYTPDGRMVGRLDHLFKDTISVKEAQIIQNKVDSIIIRIVRHDSYNVKSEEYIKKKATERLGHEISISFEYTDEIERTKRGKFQFIVSNLKQTNKFRLSNI